MSCEDKIRKLYITFAVAEKQWYKVFTTNDHSKVVKFKQEHIDGCLHYAVLKVTYVSANKDSCNVEIGAVGVDEVCMSDMISPSQLQSYFIGFVKQGPPEQLEWIRTLKTSDEAEMMAFYDDKVKAKHPYVIVTSNIRESSDGTRIPIDSINVHSCYDPCKLPPPPPPGQRTRV